MLIAGLAMVLHGISGIFGGSDQFNHPLLATMFFGFLILYPMVILYFALAGMGITFITFIFGPVTEGQDQTTIPLVVF